MIAGPPNAYAKVQRDPKTATRAELSLDWFRQSSCLLGFVTPSGFKSEIAVWKRYGLLDGQKESLKMNYDRYIAYLNDMNISTDLDVLRAGDLRAAPFWFRVTEVVVGPYTKKLTLVFTRAFQCLPELLPDNDPDEEVLDKLESETDGDPLSKGLMRVPVQPTLTYDNRPDPNDLPTPSTSRYFQRLNRPVATEPTEYVPRDGFTIKPPRIIDGYF